MVEKRFYIQLDLYSVCILSKLLTWISIVSVLLVSYLLTIQTLKIQSDMVLSCHANFLLTTQVTQVSLKFRKKE